MPQSSGGRWLTSSWVSWVVIACAIGLELPSVTAGFALDDYFMLSELRNATRSWVHYDLYHFVAAESVPLWVKAGLLPWWTSSNLDIHLFRPLTSVLLSVDFRLFGDWATGYHLHSLVWLLALLLLVRGLFRRLLDPNTATLSLAVFALSSCLATPAGWIAARHLLVAATPSVAALLLLTRGPNLRYRRWLAAVVFMIGLCAGEAALGGLAFWFAYELFGPEAGESKQRGSSTSSRCRWRATAPVAIGIAYLGAYRLVGAGVRGSGLYLDPMSNPLGYLRGALVRVPLLLGNALFGIDGGPGLVWAVPMVVIGLAVVALIAWLTISSWSHIPASERMQLQWLVSGALIASIGTVGGAPGGRALVLPQLGFAPLLAVILRYGWCRFAQERGSAPRIARVCVISPTELKQGIAIEWSPGPMQLL